MKRILMFLGVLLVSLPLVVNAASCTDSDIVSLKKVAAKVNGTVIVNEEPYYFNDPDTDEEIESVKKTLAIHLSGINDKVNIELTHNNITLFESNEYDEEEFTYHLISDKTVEHYIVNIYGTGGCQGVLLHSFTIDVPRYNTTSNMGMCSGAKDFYLCQEYVYYNDSMVSNAYEKIQEYKDGKIDKEGKKIEKKPFFKALLDFMQKHQVIFIVIALALAGFVVFSITRRNKMLKKHFN